MGDDGRWPPRSAHEALMSSPNGRRKFADSTATRGSSPVKRGQSTPSFLDQLRAARNGQSQNVREEQIHNTANVEEEDEEDEETLKLQLAALEARLKLKKLQKSKRDVDPPSPHQHSRETAVAGYDSHVEVPLSPSKRHQISAVSKSPNRVVLGIDKGVKAADVSLRRARTTTGSPLKDYQRFRNDHGRLSSAKPRTASTQKSKEAIAAIKSFSERMAHSREKDREDSVRRERINNPKRGDTGINLEELEMYKSISTSHSESHSKTSVPVTDRIKPAREVSYTREEILNGGRLGPSLVTEAVEHHGDSTLFEGFSDLHLSSRVLPHSFLKRSLPTDRFTPYKIPGLLKVVTSPTYELPDEVGDFVVFGIIASKSQPLDSKRKVNDKLKSSDQSNLKWDDGSMNEKKFMAITVTDLTWTVNLYLFDTAVPRYHRLSVGTVIAIVNPTIMPPRKGQEDTGAFSLSLHNNEDIVLEIGQARDLGFCNALKKDQRECGTWIDASKTEICEYHLNIEIAKTQAGRMGVNGGSNGFGGRGSSKKGGDENGDGLLPARNGRGFDRETMSHYYIASAPGSRRGKSNPVRPRAGMSAAKMLDLDIDDPFIAEGQYARNKEALLQKRMASQEKEREIARELGKHRSRTNAGAEYLRQRNTSTVGGGNTGNTRTGTANDVSSGSSTQLSSQGAGLDLRAQIGRKRAAQDVQLSPVKKKTRFLTSKGIKEAGRDSLGPTKDVRISTQNDDDDDDLDIV